MALVRCEECKREISDSAPSCPHCGTHFESAASEKKVGLLLGTGILFLPFVFSWLTLRKGYSKQAKTISFAWLAVIFVSFLFQDDTGRATNPTFSASTSSNTSTASSTNNITVQDGNPEAINNTEGDIVSQLIDETSRTLAEENFLAKRDIRDDPIYASSSTQELISLADNGDPVAQRKVGIDYFNNQQYEDGLQYLKLADENGERLAIHAIGMAYYYGYGVNEDEPEAFSYFKRAAELGHLESISTVANYYYRGDRGITKNLSEAAEWWKLGAKLGGFESWEGLKILIARNEGLSPEEISQDERLRNRANLNENYCGVLGMASANATILAEAENIYQYFANKEFDQSIAFKQCQKCAEEAVDSVLSVDYSGLPLIERSRAATANNIAAGEIERDWDLACRSFEF